MEIKIKSIHFDATEKLEQFITKKVEKLVKHYEEIALVGDFESCEARNSYE